MIILQYIYTQNQQYKLYIGILMSKITINNIELHEDLYNKAYVLIDNGYYESLEEIINMALSVFLNKKKAT